MMLETFLIDENPLWFPFSPKIENSTYRRKHSVEGENIAWREKTQRVGEKMPLRAQFDAEVDWKAFNDR